MPSLATVVTYHVHYRPRSKRWAVVRDGGLRPSALLPSQRRAQSRAVKLAKKKKVSSVVVHNRNGSVLRVVPVQTIRIKVG